MPAELARSTWEIRRLELVFTAYTLSIIARYWPEVSARSPVEGLYECWGDKFWLSAAISHAMKSSVTPSA